MPAEENFVQLYVRGFLSLATRAETGVSVEDSVQQRIKHTREHAAVMDRVKSKGHLEAVVERLEAEAIRPTGRGGLPREGASERRTAFLQRIAGLLREPEDSPA
jgi:hypothetical protein